MPIWLLRMAKQMVDLESIGKIENENCIEGCCIIGEISSSFLYKNRICENGLCAASDPLPIDEVSEEKERFAR